MQIHIMQNGTQGLLEFTRNYWRLLEIARETVTATVK